MAGCGPPWRVIRQSGPPSALRGATQVIVATDLSAMYVNGKTVDQVMAERSPDEQRAMGEAIAALQTGFIQGFATNTRVSAPVAQGPPMRGEGVRVTARFTNVDPGKYAFVYTRDTMVTARIVWTIDGQVVDEIETTRRVDASMSQPAIIQRMRIGGRRTGELAASFFRRARR